MENNSKNGHWVTINGNHIFIKDSQGERVLKSTVRKTQLPKNAEDENLPNDYHRGGDGGENEKLPDENGSIWKTIGKILISTASIALEAMASSSSSQSRGGYSGSGSSHTYSSSKIEQYKSQINNLVNLSKTSISEESKKLGKMIEEVSAMPKSPERDSKWQEVLSKGAEIDEVKAIINNIETYNTHDMPEKIVEEFNKLSDSLPQNYIKNLPLLDGNNTERIPQNSYNPNNYNNVFTDSIINKLFGSSPAYAETISQPKSTTNNSAYSNSGHSKFVNGRYDRIAAVKYATNPNYSSPFFSDQGRDLFGRHNPAYSRYQADCTNFVSQAIKAGGMIPTNEWHYNSPRWVNIFSNNDSPSWTVAKDLLNYLKNQGYINGKPIPIYSMNELKSAAKTYNIQSGDLIFQSDNKNGIHHAMIITKIDQYGTIYYSAHTRDKINQSTIDPRINLFYSDKVPQTILIVRIK
jgi:hypothetical protein